MRTLKIERAGDFFRKNTFPKIRLQGKWLANLGFPPGSRVSIAPVADGQIVLTVTHNCCKPSHILTVTA
jgi:hypothetical protein